MYVIFEMVGYGMASLGYCDIRDLVLSDKSRKAIGNTRELMSQGDLLSGALAMTPFYSIFGTPSVTTSAFEKLATIREHDWVTFGEAMSSSGKITRKKIYEIADQMTWVTVGEEQKFWKCVANASL